MEDLRRAPKSRWRGRRLAAFRMIHDYEIDDEDLRSKVEIYTEDRRPDLIGLVGSQIILPGAVQGLVTAAF